MTISANKETCFLFLSALESKEGWCVGNVLQGMMGHLIGRKNAVVHLMAFNEAMNNGVAKCSHKQPHALHQGTYKITQSAIRCPDTCQWVTF